ncbi:MAG: BRO family protein [Treponema sp.]
MNDIQAFTSPLFGEIRTYTENGHPFFSLADVCRILDLQQVSRVKDRLNKDGVMKYEERWHPRTKRQAI